MLRSFPASSGEGRRSCPNFHTAPAASHALQGSKGRAGRCGGDSKRHEQKPRLKRQRCLQGRVTANPPGQSSLMFLVAGRRQRPGTIHHTDRETQPSPPCQGRAGASESEPCRLCQAACVLPIPGILQDCSQGGRQSRNKLGELDFYFSASVLSFSCNHVGKSAPSSFLCRARTEAPQTPQTGFTEASKPGRASPTGKGL